MFELVQGNSAIDRHSAINRHSNSHQYSLNYESKPSDSEWDTAVDLLVSMLKEVKPKLGPKESVVLNTSESYYPKIFAKLGSNEYYKSNWTATLIALPETYRFATEFVPKVSE